MSVAAFGPDRLTSRTALVLLAVCLALSLALCGAVLARDYFIGTDGSLYAVVGDNLLAGRGYQIAGLPHTLFPPGFPIAIGLLRRAVPDLELAGHLVSLLAFAAAACFAFLTIRRLTSRGDLALLAAALFLFTGFAVSYAGQVMAESLFAALAQALFYAALRAAGDDAPRRRWIWPAAIGALGGYLYLTKPEGLLYFGAVLAALVLWRRDAWRTRLIAAAVAALVFLAVAAPWVAFLSRQTGRLTWTGKLINRQVGVERAVNETFGVFYQPTPAGDAVYFEKPQLYRADTPWMSNLGLYPRYLLQQLKDLRNLLGNIGIFFLLAGAGYCFWRTGRRALVWLLVAGPPFALPLFFPDKRFWLPLLPASYFFIAAGVLALAHTADRLTRDSGVRRIAAPLALALVVINAAAVNAESIRKVMRVDDSVHHRLQIREIAADFRAQHPEAVGRSLLASRAWFAFYAGCAPRHMAYFADPKDLCAYMARNNIPYVLLDEHQFGEIARHYRALIDHPEICGLRLLMNSAGLLVLGPEAPAAPKTATGS